MKIAILGDSHNHLEMLDQLHRENRLQGVELILHTGDMCNDGGYLEDLTGIKVIGVKGNCDPVYNSCEEEVVLTLEGYKIFLTHGHQYGVQGSNDRLFYRGKEIGADIVIFGHSHIPLTIEEENMILLNPGSIGFPRGLSRKSYAVISLEQNIRVDLMEMEE